MITVLTIGTFDLLHPGHVHLFTACRLLAGTEGRVVVGVNLDAFISAFKGHPPVQTYGERASMVSAVRGVDEVLPNTAGSDAKPLIERVQPTWIAIGSDWCRDGTADAYYRQLDVTEQWLDEHKVAVLFVPRRGHQSSTDLRDRIRA